MCGKGGDDICKILQQRQDWLHWLDFVTPPVEYGADLRDRCRLCCVVGRESSDLFVVALVIWRFKTTQPKHVELLRALIGKWATLAAGELHTFQTLINPTTDTEPLARDFVESLSTAEAVEEVAVVAEASTSTPHPPEEPSRMTSSLKPLVVSKHDEAIPVIEGNNLELNNTVLSGMDALSFQELSIETPHWRLPSIRDVSSEWASC
ncbi:uncharacterized protein PG998_011846 [Apiospora kogelbergensis]|uniref:uncharacterized protein n=1 Tax=Apiospora kogelbergensis TaxID=1337665 RepID=UPI00312F82BD